MIFRRPNVPGEFILLFLGKNYIDWKFKVKERFLKTFLESYRVLKTLLSKFCKKFAKIGQFLKISNGYISRTAWS